MTNKDEEIDIEELAIRNAGNFGEPMDMFHPEYGWILKDGKPTEAGLKFFQDNREKLGEKHSKLFDPKTS